MVEAYVRIAGRRERARTEEEVLDVDNGGRMESVDFAVVGARSARSTMKLPAATLEGVCGRWRKMVMS